ncbi:MAG: succinate dehydrogenase/fumarate reductase iron-sulfur subunit [Propionibacteriaceae bacterium]|nr:succinate dehydrogenase/fumarate reductase iron-sulfur subunit [Propionibacteriaceae bacterium]
MSLTLRIWRQPNAATAGKISEYKLAGVSSDMSFLEMLDMLNEELTVKGEEPVAFDYDCREGICGMCGIVINGVPHGRGNSAVATTTCQLHMRNFKDGDVITIEPWRATPFPIIKDLVVDRRAFDKIIASGGYISVNTGAAPEAHANAVSKLKADRAFDAATCVGCGACVAACPNHSGMLFVAAKITHLAMLPQGQPERPLRIKTMIGTHDELGFAGCQNAGECAAVCPKEIPLDTIAQLNRDLIASLFNRAGKSTAAE